MSKGGAWTTYTVARAGEPRSLRRCGKEGQYNVTYRPNTNNGFIQITKRNSGVLRRDAFALTGGRAARTLPAKPEETNGALSIA